MDELSQLDGLEESDILDALNQNTNDPSLENENVIIQDQEESILIEDVEDTEEEITTPLQKENLVTSTIKSDDLASLLSQLLNNKTIEITIKIKD
jgi:hypothetical protein